VCIYIHIRLCRHIHRISLLIARWRQKRFSHLYSPDGWRDANAICRFSTFKLSPSVFHFFHYHHYHAQKLIPVYIYIYIYILYMCVCVCLCVRPYICVHIYTHIRLSLLIARWRQKRHSHSYSPDGRRDPYAIIM
jgi:hypothetical protein